MKIQLAKWIALVVTITIIQTSLAQEQYAPGIPMPDHCLSNSNYVQPTQWPSSEAEGTYYIDNTSRSSVDVGNKWGYPDRPRTSLPSGVIGEGAVIVVTGGPYSSNKIQLTFEGTASSPILMTTSGSPGSVTIRSALILQGQYFTIENFRFVENNKTIQLSAAKHGCVRHNIFSGPGTNARNNAVISILGSSTSNLASNNVVFDNQIFSFGDTLTSIENDYHGVLPGKYSDNNWIIGNIIHGNGGDSIQVGQASYTSGERPTNVYIARNELFGDRENAVDIKRAKNVFVSSNYLHSYRKSSSSEGAAIIIHNGPDNVWIINNIIEDAEMGVVGTGSLNTWLIGNIISNISHSGSSWDPRSGYASGAAVHFRGVSNGGIVANTLFGYDIGIQLTQGDSIGYVVQNNILSGRRTTNGDDIRIAYSGILDRSSISHELIHGNGGAMRVSVSGTTYTSINMLTSRTGQFSSTITDNPRFLNEAGRDFRLKPDSPARDSGIVPYIIQRFQDTYGRRIDIDRADNNRSTMVRWDLGAYSFESVVVPREPVNLN